MYQKPYHFSLVNRLTPKFIKKSTKFNNLRSQVFQIQMQICNLMKERGNTFYKQSDFRGACNIYEELFSYFEYREFSNKDKEEYFVKYYGNNKDEHQQLQLFRITVLNNLSAAYLKLSMFPETIEAASYSLQIDINQAKALFRRAKVLSYFYKKARLASSTISDDDLLSSIKDLEKAQNLEPDEFISVTYQTAMNIWNQRQIVRNSISLMDSAELSYDEVNQNVDSLKEVQELRQFTEKKGKERVQLLKSQGKVKEANDFLLELNQAQEAKKQLEKISRLDFNKPKPYLTEIIKRLGVNSKQLQLEFRKMQQQHLEDIRNKLTSWNNYYSDNQECQSTQGSQGEQRQYPSENKILNLIFILIGIFIFILIGVLVAGIQ